MEGAAAVQWVPGIGGRNSFERIGRPNDPIIVAKCLEDGTHQNAGATPPDTGFNEITGNIALKNAANTLFQVVQPLHSYHGLSFGRPVPAFHTFPRVEPGTAKREIEGIQSFFNHRIE